MFKICFYFLFILIFTACATEQPLITDRYVWPPPPDTPRIEWLATYSSQLDLPKSSFRVFKETIVGEDKPISLKRPVDARIDSFADKIYVADMDVPAVFIFDRKENELRNLDIDKTNDRAAFIKPISLTLDNDRNLYVLDGYTRNVLLFNSAEKFQKTIELNNITEMPVSIFYDKKQNHLLIADAKKNQIIVVDSTGKRKFAFGRSGDGAGEFNRPVGMAINSRSEIIVADTFNARVQIFDAKGQFLKSFGTRGDGNAQFQLIKGVAVDPDDNIYVTDSRSNTIKIFNSDGLPLLVFGGYYAVATTGKIAAGGFALPIGIDIDKNGTIAIVDQLNSRVQIFRYLNTTDSIQTVK